MQAKLACGSLERDNVKMEFVASALNVVASRCAVGACSAVCALLCSAVLCCDVLCCALLGFAVL